MGFFRQEYWSGLPLPSPGDLPNPRIELASPVSPALADEFFITETPGKPLNPVTGNLRGKDRDTGEQPCGDGGRDWISVASSQAMPGATGHWKRQERILL